MKNSPPLFQTALRSSLAAASFWITLAGLAYAYAAFSPLSPVNANDPLSASAWNLMVANLNDLNSKTVPTGGVMAFFGTACPTGWSAADGTANGVKKTDGTSGTLDLRGEFVRGLDNGRGADSGRTLGSAQEATGLAIFWSSQIVVSPSNTDGNYGTSSSYAASSVSGPYTGSYYRFRPRNVALLYCVKN